ncbi:MAG: type II secretion system protein [Verrucomicrobiota bacterium]
MKKSNQSAFTLIELLVVLAIIGILAGLLFPAVKAAMNTARRTQDVNNVRNIAMGLITESMERTGFFRVGPTIDQVDKTSTSLEVFQGMLDDELLDDPGIFYGYGAIKADSYTLRNENIGFQYIAGYHDASNSRLPLLITKGTGVQKSDLIGKSIPVGTSAWGNAGVVVGYVSGSALWIRNNGESEETLELDEPLGMAKNVPDVVVYE